MHILFVHQTYPSQFGPVAEWICRSKNHRVTFVSTDRSQRHGAIENIRYKAPAEIESGKKIPWTRYSELHLRQCEAVAQTLKKRPDIQPNLVVGHSGLGPTLLIPEVLDCPIVSYFEYFMHPRRNDILYRKDFDCPDWYRFWRRAVNAIFLLDLENCRAGYSPTLWQRSLLPGKYQAKTKVFFDGIDTTLFRPVRKVARTIGKTRLPLGVRIVTYVARGFEATRGFDIFMKIAKRIYSEYPNVLFVVAGTERIHYGPDAYLTGNASFKKWVLKQDSYDLSKFRFVGWLPRHALARLFNLTDLHIYLTTPFPLSWSLFQALACGATVLASDTGPVRELITHHKNGLLANFFDVDGMAEQALRVLRDPARYSQVRKTAANQIRTQYSAKVVLPRLLSYFQQHANCG
jgi:glycosyltransferase involved in cell wall biosynthesis